MPRGEMHPEELRAIKEEVNKEGTQMEEGEEGGAAVFIGTKEEVTKARQLAETEGKAPDLASYIIMHKEILASSDELQNYVGADYAKDFEKVTIGSMRLLAEGTGNEFLLYFKDSSSNFAKVKIDTKKITSLEPKLSRHWVAGDKGVEFNVVQRELEKLGFESSAMLALCHPIKMEGRIKKGRLDKTRDKQREGFVF